MTDSLVSKFRKMYEGYPRLSFSDSKLFEKDSDLLKQLIIVKNSDVGMLSRYDLSKQLTEEDWAKLEQVEAMFNSPLMKALK